MIVKGWKIALLCAALLLVTAFASAEMLPLDGAYHSGELTEANNGLTYTFSVTEPSKVTCELRTACVWRVEINNLCEVWGNMDGDGMLYTRAAYLNPGTHTLRMYSHHGEFGPFQARLIAQPLAQSLDAEPNGEEDQAIPMTLGQNYDGLSTLPDTDFYRFTLTEDSEVETTLDCHDDQLNCAITRPGEPNRSYGSPETIYTEPGKPVTRTFKSNLRAGTYLLGVYPGGVYSDSTGRYTLCVKVLGASQANIRLDSTSGEMRCGDRGRLTLYHTPEHYNWPETVWTSSNPKVLSVDDDGDIEALRPGKAIIRATVGEHQATARIVVKANAYSRSKPLFGKKRGLYVSHKKLFFRDGYLWCEVFLTNRTKTTIRALPGLTGIVYDYGNEMALARVPLGVWQPKKPLKPNRTAVIKFKFPAGEVYAGSLRLASKSYEALVTFEQSDAAGKSANAGEPLFIRENF